MDIYNPNTGISERYHVNKKKSGESYPDKLLQGFIDLANERKMRELLAARYVNNKELSQLVSEIKTSEIKTSSISFLQDRKEEEQEIINFLLHSTYSGTDNLLRSMYQFPIGDNNVDGIPIKIKDALNRFLGNISSLERKIQEILSSGKVPYVNIVIQKDPQSGDEAIQDIYISE